MLMQILKAKKTIPLALISENPGLYTFSSLSRQFNVSVPTVSMLLNSLVASGNIIVTQGKANKNYLSLKPQSEEGEK